MFLADLHVHSRFSDGAMTIPELVDFYGIRGFGCIAITDHLCERHTLLGIAARYLNITLNDGTFESYMETIRDEAIRAWKLYRMVVLPGFEITKNALSNHRSAHILGIGIEEFVNPGQDVVSVARSIRGQGGLAVAAHPVSTGKAEIQTLHLWSRRQELKHEFDAWEVASGAEMFDEVLKSGLPMIATSDLHHAKQINAWKTVFECERHPQAILEAVRRQDLRFQFYNEKNLNKPAAIADTANRFNKVAAFT